MCGFVSSWLSIFIFKLILESPVTSVAGVPAYAEGEILNYFYGLSSKTTASPCTSKWYAFYCDKKQEIDGGL